MKAVRAVGALVLVLLLFPSPVHLSEAKAPESKSVFTVNSFDGGRRDVTVPLGNGSTDTSLSITLPANAQVVNASFKLTGLPFTEGGRDCPLDPALDIGADGKTDWKYSGFAHGLMGYQSSFHDGERALGGYNLTFDAGGGTTLLARLPVNASEVRASMSLGGWPTPFWREPARVTPGTDSEGESTPVLYSAGDRLWCAWATEDPLISDGTDSDIVVSWSADGTSWSAPEEITARGDALEDDSPDIIAHGGRVFVAWAASASESQFAPSNILIRSWDGERWGSVDRLTPPGLWYRNDWPQMEVFRDRLFVFWKTTDPLQASIYDDGDIDMVYRTYDGSRWAPILEVTPSWSQDIDWSLNLALYRDRLYVFWDTDVDLSDEGFQVDIYYRYFDGTAWSEPRSIIPVNDHELDEIPKAAVYFNPVTGQEELWVVWIRGSPSDHDLNIMARRYDGTAWGPMVELTDPEDEQDNMGQEILEYDHRLYVVWVTGTNTSEESNSSISIYNTFGDVVIRAYDGYRWSDLMELTPGEENDNANAPTIAVYRGKLFVGWAYPFAPKAGGKETWDIIVRNIDFRPVELELDIGADGLSDWGPSELQSTNEVVPIYPDELARAFRTGPFVTDPYGNVLCDVGIRVRSIYPSVVQVGNLSISYSLTASFENITELLNGLLAESPGRAGEVRIPLALSASSDGRLRLHDLNLTYIINQAPLGEGIPDASFPEDTDAPGLLDLEEYFWDDWDDGLLQFEVTYQSGPAHVEARLEGRRLGFSTPAENWFGTESFRVRAWDRGRLWAESPAFNITVLPSNDPPVLEPVSDQHADVGEVVRFDVRASDIDDPSVLLWAQTSRFELQRTGPFEGSVRFVASRPGTFDVNFTADDGHGGTDNLTVRFFIRDRVVSATSEPCLTWIVIVSIAVGAVVGAELYRRWHVRETGPVVSPDEKLPEEMLFAGRVHAVVKEPLPEMRAGASEEAPGAPVDTGSEALPIEEMVPDGTPGDGAEEAFKGSGRPDPEEEGLRERLGDGPLVEILQDWRTKR